MRYNLLFIFILCFMFSRAQNIKTIVTDIKNTTQEIKKTNEELKSDSTQQDTVRKKENSQQPDNGIKNNIAIGDQGSNDNTKDNKNNTKKSGNNDTKGKQIIKFVNDPNQNSNTSPAPSNIAIGDQGSTDNPKKNNTQKKTVQPVSPSDSTGLNKNPK